jgi:PKD repeat protein
MLVASCGGDSGQAAPPNQAPVARFGVTPAQGSIPLLVRFDATASNDDDGAI